MQSTIRRFHKEVDSIRKWNFADFPRTAIAVDAALCTIASAFSDAMGPEGPFALPNNALAEETAVTALNFARAGG
jgi:hypothetical protein